MRIIIPKVLLPQICKCMGQQNSVKIAVFFCHSDFAWNQNWRIFDFWVSKSAIVGNLVSLNFDISEFLQCLKSEIYQITNSEPLKMAKNPRTWFHVKSGWQKNFWNFHTVNSIHCIIWEGSCFSIVSWRHEDETEMKFFPFSYFIILSSKCCKTWLFNFTKKNHIKLISFSTS